ncbi:MAG: phosphoglucosamine mutase [Proteobacteria bacterium]|nr:phosphoglucosamine mutase [Pseudomonadota bacterium]
MKRQFFGTDGVRGKANTGNLTPEMAMRLAQAAAQVFRANSTQARPTVIIGKDTRLSGYMFESAMEAGFTSMGFYTLMVGPMPTPAVALLTRSLRADLGVMISASHNPFQDNGIKFFAGDGFKLADELEMQIEDLMLHPEKIQLAEADAIGQAVRVDDAAGRYMEFCKTTVDRDFKLDGMKVVVDCANGATYKIAPKIFWELGAEVIRIGSNPDGRNINQKCGSTDPDAMRSAVVAFNADIGVALDGDGDRLILCDEHARVIDGDQIMAAIAADWHARGLLKGQGLVATQMSNMGLERFMLDKGLHLVRANVGDRYVVEAMRAGGYNFGGEQSGHLIFMDHVTTGDGIVAALQFLSVMKRTGKKASELARTFMPYPQSLQNVRLTGLTADEVLGKGAVQAVIKDSESSLNGHGRVLIRKSGTEPVIRVMVEAAEETAVNAHLSRIVAAIEANLA